MANHGISNTIVLEMPQPTNKPAHYCDVIMGEIASQITSLTIVYSTVYADADQRKHQSSASLAFVRGIHRGSVNSPHKWPVTRKMFPFDDVIMDMYIILHDKSVTWSSSTQWVCMTVGHRETYTDLNCALPIYRVFFRVLTRGTPHLALVGDTYMCDFDN